ncbi:MAG: hypothetical protein ABR503_10815, partial [Chitinophagaceae bacterium]
NIFSLADYTLFERANYVLALQPSYNDLFNAYRQNIKRNIKKAIQYGCEIKKNIPVEPVIHLAKGQSNSDEGNFLRFEKLFNHLHPQKKAITYGVYSGEQLILKEVIFVIFLSFTAALALWKKSMLLSN